MTPTQACMSQTELQQLANEELPMKELNRIEEHLSECSRCRELLDTSDSKSSWLNEIREVLSTPPLGANSLPANSLTANSLTANSLTANSLTANSLTDDAGDESILRLLGPSDDPRSLGRIGNYEVTGVIGRGGMGIVFKAMDVALDRPVAIKMSLPHLAASGAARQRFSREAQAAAAVIDDHVLPIYSVDMWQGIPYLVTQYSRGTTLQKRIQDQGPLQLKEILRIGLQTARGLAAAHAQGLVHRDVKPSNILLDGTVERALLTDFGLARAADDIRVTQTGTVAGTPQYMSPEQVRGESVDARSDLFSLGCTMYAMCTGRPPFRSDSTFAVMQRITDSNPSPIREINPDIPEWLGAIVAKLMSKKADDRFTSAREVAQLLEDCLAHVQQPTAVPLPQDVPQWLSTQPNGRWESGATRRTLPILAIWCRAIKPILAIACALGVILAGTLIVLELNKGTIRIESELDDVPIKIMQGDEIVEKLTVSRKGDAVRIAAGGYIVQLDGNFDGITVRKSAVTLKRGGREVVKLVRQSNTAHASSTNRPAELEREDSSTVKYSQDFAGKQWKDVFDWLATISNCAVTYDLSTEFEFPYQSPRDLTLEPLLRFIHVQALKDELIMVFDEKGESYRVEIAYERFRRAEPQWQVGRRIGDLFKVVEYRLEPRNHYPDGLAPPALVYRLEMLRDFSANELRLALEKSFLEGEFTRVSGGRLVDAEGWHIAPTSSTTPLPGLRKGSTLQLWLSWGVFHNGKFMPAIERGPRSFSPDANMPKPAEPDPPIRQQQSATKSNAAAVAKTPRSTRTCFVGEVLDQDEAPVHDTTVGIEGVHGMHKRPFVDEITEPIWGNTMHGIQLGISGLRQNAVFRPGAKIRFALHLRNTSDETIHVVNYWPKPLGNRISPVIETAAGKRVEYPASPRVRGGHQKLEYSLPPGETVVVDLQGMLMLGKDGEDPPGELPQKYCWRTLSPGDYRIHAAFLLTPVRPGQDKTSSMPFTVTSGGVNIRVSRQDEDPGNKPD